MDVADAVYITATRPLVETHHHLWVIILDTHQITKLTLASGLVGKEVCGLNIHDIITFPGDKINLFATNSISRLEIIGSNVYAQQHSCRFKHLRMRFLVKSLFFANKKQP